MYIVQSKLFRIHATDWIAERIYDYVGGVCELYVCYNIRFHRPSTSLL